MCCGNVLFRVREMMRDKAVLILQSFVEVKHCILSFSPAHMLPRQAHIFSRGKDFCLLRALWCERCTGVLKCLSLFSWQSFLCVGVYSFQEHLGNGFQQMEVLTGVLASKIRAICFCSKQKHILICLLVCLFAYVLFFQQHNHRVCREAELQLCCQLQVLSANPIYVTSDTIF